MYRSLKMPILELRKNGKSYREIEKELQCSRSVIHYHCNNQNLNDTGKKRYAIADDLKLKISEFCKKNKKSDAQKYFNLSKATIFKYRNFELKDEQK
jgi:DNA invertase Pin-like site-specific DNA recombinase